MQRVPDAPITSLNIDYEPSTPRTKPRSPWAAVFLQPVALCTALATLPVLVALIVIETSSTPAQRPFVIYDATISYAQNSSTIPYWAAWLLPGIVLLLVAVALELTTNSRLAACALLWHEVVNAVAGLIVVNLLTSVGKEVVGYLRPDFLARCQPAGETSLTNTTLMWGNAITTPPCSQQGSAVTEGQRSFPSGMWCTAPAHSD